MTIRPVVLDIHLPAGIAGPDPLDLDVRCFLVTHESGVALVDTGPPGSAERIGSALDEIGAAWTDVTDILLSHDHIDHIGSLDDVTRLAPHATVWGNAPLPARRLDHGQAVRGLTVLATPGHTDGHVSLLHAAGALLVGDIVGNQHGTLSRAPAPFTTDPAEAERSLHHISTINFDRLLTAHGAELPYASDALRALIDSSP